MGMYDTAAETAPSSRPTTLQEQLNRVAGLIDQAGAIRRRVTDVATQLVGDFLAPGYGEPSHEPNGQIELLRSLLDEIEHRQRDTAFALEVAENALRDPKSVGNAKLVGGI